ncbi:uncharacterized protein LOC143299913 [Babylonia areolata]|uniref:uncharacterized protein LOC143299913 n=1 Tax=Babylonia areolata TaxID=304850 RepID=UPI003FCF88C0
MAPQGGDNHQQQTASSMRKVVYDDYTNRFYVEGRLEALERQVATRAQQTYVLNRSHDTRLLWSKKQVEAEHIIFCKRSTRDAAFHQDQLKDHVAHRHVLRSIARARARVVDSATGRRAESHLGFYGAGASKTRIQPEIDRTVRENTRSALRRKNSVRILRERRAVPLFDRTRTTSALLRMKSEIQSRPASDFKPKPQGCLTTEPKAIHLPPIAVPDFSTGHQRPHLRTDTPALSDPPESAKGGDSAAVARERTPAEDASGRPAAVFLT